MTPTRQRQAQILQATLDLVAEQGLVGTTISQISKRSNAGPGIIYHYFTTKDDIIHTVFQSISNEYAEFLLVGFPKEASWLDKLKHIWLRSYHFFVNNPKKALFQEQYKNSPYYHPEYTLESEPYFADLIQPFLVEVEKGNLKPLPFPVLYAMTVGVALNIAKLQIEGAVQPDEIMLETLAEASCRSIAA
jgi:AcrR family transcriptional regulator